MSNKKFFSKNGENKIKNNYLPLFLANFTFISCSAQIIIPHKIETINFQSGNFNVVGELGTPESERSYPLVIMVHSNGPAYRTYFAKLKELMLRAGYATFMWDKPGYGKLTGNFSNEKRLAERHR